MSHKIKSRKYGSKQIFQGAKCMGKNVYDENIKIRQLDR